MKVEEQAKHIPIPLSQTWDLSDKILGLKIFLIKIIQTTIQTDPMEFIRIMILSQFTPLFDDVTIPQLYCQYSEEKKTEFWNKWKHKFEPSVSHFARVYTNIDHNQIIQLEVFTYIEKLTSICLGPENVYPFLKACFL